MSHLHHPKTIDMAPKTDPGTSAAANRESVQPGFGQFYPPPGYLETMKKEQISKAKRQRGAAKGSFTRAFNRLTELLTEPNLLTLEKEVDDSMDKLKKSYNKVVSFHEDFITLDDEIDEDEEERYLREIETNYSNIQKEFRAYYAALKQNEVQRQADLVPVNPVRIGLPVGPALAMTPDQKLQFQMLGMNFSPAKECIKFDGSNQLLYRTFKTKWIQIDTKLNQLERSEAERLYELKRCLAGEALELVEDLSEDDGNYQVAWQLLDNCYEDNSVYADNAITKLMECPKMVDTAKSARSVYASILKAGQTLDSLKITDKQRGELLFMFVAQSKLSQPLLKRWLDEKQKKKDSTHPLGTTATIEDLKTLIFTHATTKATMESMKEKDKQDHSGSQKKPEKQPQSKTVPGSYGAGRSEQKEDNKSKSTSIVCTICAKPGHFPLNCNSLRNKTSEAVMEIVRSKSLCFVCYGKHQLSKCNFKRNCAKCQKRHSDVLHDAIANFKPSSSNSVQSPSVSDDLASMTASCHPKNSTAILHSAMAWIIAPDGGRNKVRVFLDSGSEICLIRRDVAENVGLDGQSATLKMSIAGGGETAETKEKRVSFQLESLDGTYRTPMIQATTSRSVTNDLRPVPIDLKEFPHLQGVKFTEPFPRPAVQIDIMIGEPFYSMMICGMPIRGKPFQPAALPTRLGMVLTGSFSGVDDQPHVTYSSNRCSLVPDLRKFWDLEHIGILPEKELATDFTVEENEAMTLMEKVTFYSETQKQWSTSLLWKDEKIQINNNMPRAVAVLKSVENTAFRKGLTTEVNAAFAEMSDNGYSEIVPIDEVETTDPTYVLQCHPVFRPEAETTKVRIVMNASAKDPLTGLSLNDLLYQGPCLLPDQVSMLLKFRFNRFIVMTDISKMFFTIKLWKDKNCLRYVWRDCDKNRDIRVYRMNGVTFGIISAPFQANFVLRKHADRFIVQFPGAHDSIHSTTYVDDVAGNRMKLDEAQTLASEIYELLLLASMKSHKWIASCKEILKNIPPELWSKADKHKVLGVQWDTNLDKINFEFVKNLQVNLVETKRSLLEQAATIYDPMGLISPFVLKAKLLFQQLWKENLKWDDSLPPFIDAQWREWKDQVHMLKNFELDRCVTGDDSKHISSATVLAFGDASENAYGSCVYLKVTYDDQTTNCHLLLGKSRVAPMSMAKDEKKKLTIVRLELLAALIAARLASYVAKILQLEVEACFTDSMITLGRIRRGPNSYKMWVGNRLNELLGLVPSKLWFYCPTQLNPADLASRGTTAEEMIGSKLWWSGPEFLKKDQTTWPHEPKHNHHTLEEKLEKSELQKENPMVLNVTEISMTTLNQIACRFENWYTFIRCVSFVLRMGYPGHKEYRSADLLLPEIRSSELFVWKTVQKSEFNEYELLKNNKEIDKNSKLKSLNPFIDKEGMMRSCTRLIHGDLTDEIKRPIILPKCNIIVAKFIQNIHMLHEHAGTDYCSAILRQRFIVCQGKREIKRILKKCTTLKCVKPRQLGQQMAPLPSTRISMPVTFSNTSIDLFGPLYVKHECSLKDCPHTADQKVYGCIFTCFHSRAIHLELLQDAGTMEFLLAFRTFSSRVGTPSMMYSDNAKGFKSADKEIRKLYKSIDWNVVKREGQKKEIAWDYSVEKSPWQNGISERMIQSVKRHTRVILGSAKLTYRTLSVILAEVEMIVNNRPLSTVSDDPDNLTPITPAELVLGRRMEALPDPNFKKLKNFDESRFTSMWRCRQLLLNQFWRRWRDDYLLRQSVRKKWTDPTDAEILNRIVIIRDDNLSRNEWKMGRVIETQKGRDGLVRTAVLKTSTGTLRRPIQRLSLLENVF